MSILGLRDSSFQRNSQEILSSPGGQIHIWLQFTLCCVKTQFPQPWDCEKLRILLLKSAANAALVAEKCNLRKRQRLNKL